MIDVEALSCQELVELVTDYLEGALSPADLRRFEDHIAGCDGCTEYLAQFRRTIELTGTLTPGRPHVRGRIHPRSASFARGMPPRTRRSSRAAERDVGSLHGPQSTSLPSRCPG